MLVHAFLERSAQARPDHLAIVHGSETATYGEVERGANRIARVLVERGFRRGDRVGLLAENSRVYVEAFFGILKSGCIAVPLNTALDGDTLRATLSDCDPRGVIAGPRFVEVAAAASAGAPSPRTLFVPRAEDAAPHAGAVALADAPGDASWDSPPAVALGEDDRAAIIYTSGSTGRPKGAVLRHSSIAANTASIVSYLELRAADRILVVLPFYYVYGQSLLTTHVAVGGRLILENRFLFPSSALDTLQREEATGFAGVPSTFAILLHKTNFAHRSMPSLRYVTQAGGPMSPSLTRRLIDALPGKKIFVMYGATEASARLAYLPPEALATHIGSIGRAIPGVELRVLRKDGTEADPEEIGEIVARGANIMEGYWGDPEETARVLDADGYHTGDLARRDADGFLWIVGRERNMIKSGAHRISPKEIEEQILEHPDLIEAAVIGVPDELLGEAIAAYVVARPGVRVDLRELEAFARERLPAYKVPRDFILRDELPKSPAGKVLIIALRGSTGGD